MDTMDNASRAIQYNLLSLLHTNLVLHSIGFNVDVLDDMARNIPLLETGPTIWNTIRIIIRIFIAYKRSVECTNGRCQHLSIVQKQNWQNATIPRGGPAIFPLPHISGAINVLGAYIAEKYHGSRYARRIFINRNNIQQYKCKYLESGELNWSEWQDKQSLIYRNYFYSLYSLG